MGLPLPAPVQWDFLDLCQYYHWCKSGKPYVMLAGLGRWFGCSSSILCQSSLPLGPVPPHPVHYIPLHLRNSLLLAAEDQDALPTLELLKKCFIAFLLLLVLTQQKLLRHEPRLGLNSESVKKAHQFTYAEPIYGYLVCFSEHALTHEIGGNDVFEGVSGPFTTAVQIPVEGPDQLRYPGWDRDFICIKLQLCIYARAFVLRVGSQVLLAPIQIWDLLDSSHSANVHRMPFK